jgi:two-component system, NarL family, nitrate/nitrite response regulator NarL
MPDLRVLIVADDPLARAGLATLLTHQPDCSVVGQVAAQADVLAGLHLYQPDVVVWDLGWEPTPWPAEAPTDLERLAEVRDTGQPVVALLSDDRYAAIVWASGVRGLLLRDVDAVTLTLALPAIAQGLVVCDAALVSGLLSVRQSPLMSSTEALTPREQEVIQLLAEGLPNKTIADRLHISEHTVKFHVNAILSKLGAQSRTEAVVRATRLGLLLL